MSYLHHVTLQTADSRISPRHEVRDDVVRMLTPLLARALAGEHVPVPGQAGYTMLGADAGPCATVTVYANESDTAEPAYTPLLTVGIAGHSRCGSGLWRALHDREGLATDPDSPPPAPWVADRLEVGAIQYASALEWTGDLSRCLAWTYLETR